MNLRVAIWAIVGASVVGFWNLVLILRASPIELDFVYLTCPLVALVRQHAISFYLALVINAVTYALIGLIVEMVRQAYTPHTADAALIDDSSSL